MVGAGAMVFAVWPYIISNARPDDGSTITLNPALLGHILGEPADRVAQAIDYLCQPDPRSSSPEEGGARLVKVGPMAYRVVNLAKYRSQVSDRKAYWATTKRKQREDAKAALKLHGQLELSGTVRDTSEKSTHADANADANANAEKPVCIVPAKFNDREWLSFLATQSCYTGIDVAREYAKMVLWCQVNRKKPSRARFINWLNKAERPMQVATVARLGPTKREVHEYAKEKWPDEHFAAWAVAFYSYWSDRNFQLNGKTIDWKIALGTQVAKWRSANEQPAES